jgi:hypothetical protein
MRTKITKKGKWGTQHFELVERKSLSMECVAAVVVGGGERCRFSQRVGDQCKAKRVRSE